MTLAIRGCDNRRMPAEQFNLCWCCQIAQGGNRPWVSLDNDFPIPICRACWKEIPKADRAELAIKFRDRGENADRLAVVIDALYEVLQSAGRLPARDLLGPHDN